jgi:hypothetical protein
MWHAPGILKPHATITPFKLKKQNWMIVLCNRYCKINPKQVSMNLKTGQ